MGQDICQELFPSRIIVADSTTKVIDVILGKDDLEAEYFNDQMDIIQNSLQQTNRNF